MQIIEEIKISAKKQSYKDSIDQKTREYESRLGSINPDLRKRFENYAAALKGEYQYIDSHTGKIVKARTYKKRLQFAEKELERIQINLSLQKKYGKLSDEDSIQISNYINSVYEIAIKNNKYVKKENIDHRANATRVKKRIQTLDDKIVADAPESTRMNTSTGYRGFDTQVNKHNPPGSTWTEKLKDEEPRAWPYSKEQLEKMNKPKQGFSIKRVLGGVAAGIALIGASLGTFYYNSNPKNDELSRINPDMIAIDPRINPDLPAVEEHKEGINNTPNSVVLTPSAGKSLNQRYSELVSPKKIEESDPHSLESYGKRAYEENLRRALLKKKALEEQLAWEEKSKKMEADRIKNEEIRRQHSNQTYQQDIQRMSRQEARKLADDIVMKSFERKSRERSRENIVVKEVTYYPDGRIQTRYPQDKIYSSTQLADKTN